MSKIEEIESKVNSLTSKVAELESQLSKFDSQRAANESNLSSTVADLGYKINQLQDSLVIRWASLIASLSISEIVMEGMSFPSKFTDTLISELSLPVRKQ